MIRILMIVMMLGVGLTVSAQDGAALYATGMGDFPGGEWSPSSPAQFTYDDGIYSLKVKNLFSFRISTSTGEGLDGAEAWGRFNEGSYGCGESGYGDVPGVKVSLIAGDMENIMCPWRGDYIITVSGDLSEITLITETPRPKENLPDDLYLFLISRYDNPPGPEWKFTRLSRDEMIYKFVCPEGCTLSPADYFFIYGEDPYTNISGSGAPIVFDADIDVWRNGNQTYFSLSENWSGVVWLKMFDMTEGVASFSNDKNFCPSWYSDVKEILAEDGTECHYYTLQGVPVESPSNGIFIRKRGAVTEKIIIR